MRKTRRFATLALLGVLAVIGCGTSQPIITDPSQLKPETPEQAKAAMSYDQKIRDEEGASYGAKAARRPVR